MGLTISIERAKELSDGIWLADLDPADVERLGRPASTISDRSVVVTSHAQYDKQSGRLSIEPRAIQVLLLGTGSKAVVIGNTGARSAMPTPQHSAGDQDFLRHIAKLPDPMPLLGRSILERLRARRPGTLRREGRRFVERPDNYWTIEPQPTKRTFLITLRGAPDRFENSRLEVGKGRGNYYSQVRVSRPDDAVEAVDLILVAKRRRD